MSKIIGQGFAIYLHIVLAYLYIIIPAMVLIARVKKSRQKPKERAEKKAEIDYEAKFYKCLEEEAKYWKPKRHIINEAKTKKWKE